MIKCGSLGIKCNERDKDFNCLAAQDACPKLNEYEIEAITKIELGQKIKIDNQRKSNMMKITEKDVQAYEDVRQSGETNMFDVTTVSILSGLSKEKILIIMKDYSDLIKKYHISQT